MFWNIEGIYIFVFSIQNIQSSFYIIFLKFFSTIFFWWIVYSFPVIYIYECLNFCYSFSMFSYFFIIQRNYYSVLKTFVILFIDGIYCCLFVFYPVKIIYIYDPPPSRFILWHLFYTITEHKRRKNHYLSSIAKYFDIYF